MSETVRRPMDPWNETTITSADESNVRQLASLLELRGQGRDQTSIREQYLDLIQVRAGERTLDVGCGTGVVTRALARRVGPNEKVIGVDPSPVMLSIAREIAEKEGVNHQIEFRVGDVRQLPFADASFDLVMAVTALSHTTDGEHAIPELLRVLRPGGRIGIFDLDTPSWIISHPDRELTRRISVAGSSIATDGWLARRLPGLLQMAGVEDAHIRAFTPLDQDPSGCYANLAERWADAALQAEAISEDERQQWLDALHAEQAAGRYFAGLTHLFVWGRRTA